VLKEFPIHSSVVAPRGVAVVDIQGDECSSEDPQVLQEGASDDVSDYAVVVEQQQKCCTHFYAGAVVTWL
jgi:hypothetical protein